MQRGQKSVSILVGGGQAYYGPTAERDKKVVIAVAQYLWNRGIDSGYDIQVLTGGTDGIPDDFATHFRGRVLDIVSSKYLKDYKARTRDDPRPYWVAGESQLKRRLAFQTNPDICAALFVQGGKYTTHEIKLMTESKKGVVTFWGSGGASGGKLAYEGWTTPKPQHEKLWCSIDPEESVYDLAISLIKDLMIAIKLHSE